MTENAFYTSLPDRGLIHIEGGQRHAFLQGLITNDLDFLKPGAALYSCLLTPQGKFLHDFFISEGDGFLLLECEGGPRAQDLYKRLTMYRLRNDVQISVEEHVPVYAVFGKAQGLGDPRSPEMGYRSFEKPDLPEKPFDAWDEHRIRLSIPDGSRDLIPGQSTLDEGRIEDLNGVSYEKGCFVGQELTARIHYRGLGKKHLYTVTPEILGLKSLPEPLSPITKDDKNIGEMRSKCGDVGLALLKDEFFSAAPASEI